MSRVSDPGDHFDQAWLDGPADEPLEPRCPICDSLDVEIGVPYIWCNDCDFIEMLPARTADDEVLVPY
jgi:hypothetical protein